MTTDRPRFPSDGEARAGRLGLVPIDQGRVPRESRGEQRASGLRCKTTEPAEALPGPALAGRATETDSFFFLALSSGAHERKGEGEGEGEGERVARERDEARRGRREGTRRDLLALPGQSVSQSVRQSRLVGRKKQE